MADFKHLDQRRGRWFFRRAIPEHLRAMFPPPSDDKSNRRAKAKGITSIELSLGTDSAIIAKKRRDIIAPRIASLLAKARAGRKVKDSELESLRAAFGRRGSLTAEEAERLERQTLREQYDWLADDPLDNPDLLARVSVGEPAEFQPAPVDYIDTAEHAKALLKAVGAPVTAESVAEVRERITRASAKTLALWERKLQPPPIDGAPARRRDGGKLPKLSDAAKQYIAERQRDPKAAFTAQTAMQAATSFRLFSDHVGDARLDEVDREDAAGFLDTLAMLHRHYGHRPQAAELSLAELLRRHPATEGEGLSNKTLTRRARRHGRGLTINLPGLIVTSPLWLFLLGKLV